MSVTLTAASAADLGLNGKILLIDI